MSIGSRIVSLREARGWSQKELASRIGLNRSVMNRIELGDRPLRDTELINISSVLGVTTDYLLGKSENPELTEDEAFEAFRNDPNLERWYRDLPKSKEEDLRRLKKIWEAFREDE